MTIHSDLPTVIGAHGAAIPPAPHTNWFADPWTALGESSAHGTFSVVLIHQEPSSSFRDFLFRQLVAALPAPPPAALAWLPQVYAHVDQGDDETAGDIVFDEIDDLLTASEFRRCDELLQMVDVKRLDTNLMICFLAATLPAKDQLPSRVELLGRIETRLKELAPDRIEALLHTLR